MAKVRDKIRMKKTEKKIVKYKRFYLKKYHIHANIGGYKKDAIIRLRCDKKTKLPIESYWRRRLKDAMVDNCITEYKEPKRQDVADPKDKDNSGKKDKD